MSDVEVTHAQRTTRADAARVLSALAKALAGDGKAELTLGSTTMQVQVPGEVDCKVEVEIDRDELEFEIELRWSTAAPEPPEPPEQGEQDTDDAAATAGQAPAAKRTKAGTK
ncbi:MAG: amphi-Trp domain-containing protein [Actinomycetota bacterium]|nr:amphi-Trp domain-containing protein [Actinomycetota bacterium]